jgi:hypothetical protein
VNSLLQGIPRPFGPALMSKRPSQAFSTRSSLKAPRRRHILPREESKAFHQVHSSRATVVERAPLKTPRKEVLIT